LLADILKVTFFFLFLFLFLFLLFFFLADPAKDN